MFLSLGKKLKPKLAKKSVVRREEVKSVEVGPGHLHGRLWSGRGYDRGPLNCVYSAPTTQIAYSKSRRTNWFNLFYLHSTSLQLLLLPEFSAVP